MDAFTILLFNYCTSMLQLLRKTGYLRLMPFKVEDIFGEQAI
jgi:hypothetical protein